MKIALLVSGNLGYVVLMQVYQRHELCCVLTDKGSDQIKDFCLQYEIPVFIGNPRGGKTNEFINNHSIEILLSVNYLFLIERDLINWPKLYAINFHGSLLPKYRGRTPHVWAIINNEEETGVTAHLINEQCDDGDIVKQIKIPISKTDTGAYILSKFNEIVPDLVNSIIEDIARGNHRFVPQNRELSTYYGKRTPDDGGINWNWQKERIYNWVRAQADPYPGAFSFIDGKKITIDEITFSEFGYDYRQPNGLILKGGSQPVVKTENGAIKLIKIRTIENVVDLLKKGKIIE